MKVSQEQREKVFDTLAELEQFFFYLSRNAEDDLKSFTGTLLEMQRETANLLLQWHNLTKVVNK